MKNKHVKFWHQRATHYDKLYWTKDKGYLNAVVKAAKFTKNDLVLDVGTGTGIVAKKVKPHVKHVVGIDISDAMLGKNAWEGISAIKWDICDALFTNSIFDKVVARMCFHHILNNLDLAISRCYDLLKPGGKIIIAEGVPPSDDKEVVRWFEKMFRLKEERLTFTAKQLKKKLLKAGFKNVKIINYRIKNFSIQNWLKNSNINRTKQSKIIQLHKRAPNKVKHAYNMRFSRGDYIIDSKNIIVIAEK